jgi:hypothetical protein
MMMKTWTLDVKEDENGEQLIELPEDLLKETGWSEGTQIEWVDNKDGSFTMKEATELVMVECISQFRQRYLVEVPKGKTEWALDTVTCEEAKEFSQLHIGETIVSHRVISKEEAIAISDVDNHYCKHWSEQQKIDNFFTLRKDYE